jgi:4-diphosphocytidyl-2-C-methyl-D-erythritol kinase
VPARRRDSHQARPAVTERAGLLRLSGYAKVNLGLEILGRRSDGFHEIVSVTQTISLADTVEATPGGPLTVGMEPPLVDEGENLARRAALALAEATGRVPSGRLVIHKRIPLAAGLGGGSSDAAAALRLLDRLWGTRLAHERLAEIAARLGSDVPLFLGGATSLIRGRGEIVEPLPGPPRVWLVLVHPGEAPPDKTRAMYQALRPDDLTDGSATVALAERLRGGSVLRAPLVNGFDGSADRVYAGLPALRLRLAELLRAPVHLTGAGPTLFGLFERPEPAHRAARAVRGAGLSAIVAHTVAGPAPIRAPKSSFNR